MIKSTSHHVKTVIMMITADIITALPDQVIHHLIVVTLPPNTVQLMWSNPKPFFIIIVKMFFVHDQKMCHCCITNYVNTYTFPLLLCPLLL